MASSAEKDAVAAKNGAKHVSWPNFWFHGDVHLDQVLLTDYPDADLVKNLVHNVAENSAADCVSIQVGGARCCSFAIIRLIFLRDTSGGILFDPCWTLSPPTQMDSIS